MNTQRQTLQIAEDAADWLLKLQSDSGDKYRQEFIAWLKHSPRHVEEFLLMSATVQGVRAGGRRGRIDVEELIAGAGFNVVPLERPHLSAPEEQRGRKSGWWMGVAAALVVAIGIGVVATHVASDTYATPTGEQRSIKLADGSFVYLNTRSRIEVKFTDRSRDIELAHGEALFVVAHEAARPFRVLTGSTVVQAVGTQFNVYDRPDAVRVSVVEGRVKIIAQEKAPALLAAGEQADIAKDGKIARQAAANTANAIAWRQRRLVFQRDTLEDIAREFNRYNRTQIRIEGGEAAQRRFTAVFNADEPQALLKFLGDDPALDITSTGATTSIRAREK